MSVLVAIRAYSNERKKGVVKLSDDVMTTLALARPRPLAGSELAIPVRRRRTFPDIDPKPIRASFWYQTPKHQRETAPSPAQT
jgi:hypothetical protein